MITLQREYLESQISGLRARLTNLEWLFVNEIKAEKLANFGCNIGGETLSLMWAMEAREAIGVDISEYAIRQANDILTSLREEIERIKRYIKFYPNEIFENDKIWWETDVPDFIKYGIINSIRYEVSDITKPTRLPLSYFDLVYCDFVLHHIWYDPLRKDAERDTLIAIREMERISKPGGIIAARELIQYGDKPQLNFKTQFKSANLNILYENEYSFNGFNGRGIVAQYILRTSNNLKE